MNDHLADLLRCIDLEQEAELRAWDGAGAADRLERRGELVRHLVIGDRDVGFGGKAILELAGRDGRHALPWHRLTPGCPVVIIEEREPGKDGERGRAVVCGVDSHAIRVAVSGSFEPERGTPLRIESLPDSVSRDRQRDAIRSLTVGHASSSTNVGKASGSPTNSNVARGRLARLRDLLCGAIPIAPWTPTPITEWKSELNASQRAAVEHALGAGDVAIIHGPPGTGKTTTVIELIRQAIARGQKVLACAPSNLATDLLVERLAAAGERVVRVGHPARVTPAAIDHTLDCLVERHPDLKIARRLIRDARRLRDDAARWTRAARGRDERRELREDAAERIADARRIEGQLVDYLLDGAAVVCATLTGVDASILGDRRFDLVVIDEAAQATEPACWIPILRCERLVLAGDHCQLPPTILSRDAARLGLGRTLMERLLATHGSLLARRLTTQYRMHSTIMEFPSAEFYEGSLEAHGSVATHTLSECPGVASDAWTTRPLRFIDTAGAGFEETREEGGASIANPGEASVAARIARRFLAAGVAPTDLAVISPYSAQVRLVRESIGDTSMEIDTVDGFQGREKEAVLVSLVRSNERGEIGFLGDYRRMNVAWTRARRALIVIGDAATIGRDPFYQRMLDHAESRQAYESVFLHGEWLDG